MKKSLLILVLALVLTFAMGSLAMAAQNLAPGYVTGDGINDYAPTPENVTSPYPDGLYLPGRDGGTIHSAYQRNTDACAACHSTHTAVGAGALLQWENSVDTCDACHDGTVTSIYDVDKGQIAATGKMTFGGLFGGSTAEGTNSLSKHNVFREGGVIGSPIAGAPGGAPTAAGDNKGSWMGDFTCVSCHDPHGKLGNFRILNPNPNGAADAAKISGEVLTIDAITKVATLAKANLLTGHGYDPLIKVDGTELKATDATTGAVNYTVDGVAGKVTFTTVPTGVVTIDYTPGIKVVGTVTGKLTAAEDVTYTSGISAFCGACHTDYNASRADDPIGILYGSYTQAYRHPMGPSVRSTAVGVKGEGGKLSCLGCHVAHGTDQTWWTSWKTISGWQGQVSAEDAGSSALKRLPNMSTCEACHAKGKANLSTYINY